MQKSKNDSEIVLKSFYVDDFLKVVTKIKRFSNLHYCAFKSSLDLNFIYLVQFMIHSIVNNFIECVSDGGSSFLASIYGYTLLLHLATSKWSDIYQFFVIIYRIVIQLIKTFTEVRYFYYYFALFYLINWFICSNFLLISFFLLAVFSFSKLVLVVSILCTSPWGLLVFSVGLKL